MNVSAPDQLYVIKYMFKWAFEIVDQSSNFSFNFFLSFNFNFVFQVQCERENFEEIL